MFKIIKNSQRSQAEKWLGKCASCGCIFLCEEGDISSKPKAGKFARCPSCFYVVEVKPEEKSMDERTRALADLKSSIEQFHTVIFRAISKLGEYH